MHDAEGDSNSPIRQRKKAMVLTLGGVILIVFIALPLPQLQRPRWEVTVVDENGRAVEGIAVRLFWQNYSIEDEGHEETLRTNKNGLALFPAQVVNVSWARRIVGDLRNVLNYFVHASFGIDAQIVVVPPDYLPRSEQLKFFGPFLTWDGAPPEMKSRVVVPNP